MRHAESASAKRRGKKERTERRLVRLWADDVLQIGINVRLVRQNDDLDRGVIFLQLDELVVSSSNGGLVGSFRDENDEEVSDVFTVDGLLVHPFLGRERVGSDEAEPGEHTIRDRQYPHESPKGTERERVVRPKSGRVVDDPDEGETGDEEEMGEPRPSLQSEESVRSHRFLISAQIGGPHRRVELREHFGVGRVGYCGSGRRSSPVHNRMKV